MQRFLRCEEVVAIYEQSLQREYPVSGLGSGEETLSRCAVNFLLVCGSVGHDRGAIQYVDISDLGILIQAFRDKLRGNFTTG